MPLRKPPARLQTLCIENIAENIVRHGQAFKKYAKDEAIFARYQLLRGIYTNDIIDKLFAKLIENHVDHKLRDLQNFMFQSEEPGNPDDWPCLELLFNEYTISLCWSPCHLHLDEEHPPIVELRGNKEHRSFASEEGQISEALVSFIISRCKNLRRIAYNFFFMEGGRLEEGISAFKNLIELDLAALKRVDTLLLVVNTCLGIRKFTGSSMEITDEILFSLCNHHPRSETFSFCPKNGRCSNAGKCLEYLDVRFNESTAEGIACALQHFPALKCFRKLPFSSAWVPKSLPNVTGGIVLLQNNAALTGFPPLHFQLRQMHFHKALSPDEAHASLISCPNLESIEVDLSVVSASVLRVLSLKNLHHLHLLFPSNEKLDSPELKQLLSRQGMHLNTISFLRCRGRLDFTYVKNILDYCGTLKSLTMFRVKFSDRNYDHLRTLPLCCGTLEKILVDVFYPHFFPSSCRNYFRKLFCGAPNIRNLDISGDFVETEIPHLIDLDCLQSLVKLVIRCADSSSVPFKQLLERSKNLKKIEFVGGTYDRGFSLCEELVARNNYKLDLACYEMYFPM